MVTYLKQFFLFSVLVVFISSCSGQNKKHALGPEQKTGTDESLKVLKPENAFNIASIGCAIQDKAGNFWFGSNGEGLYFYNGKSFVHYTTKHGLDNMIVYSVFEDRSGKIWIGTRTGLLQYNPSAKNGEKNFIPVSLNDTYGPSFNSSGSASNGHYAQNAVWTMMQDKNGKIWFGANNGVYIYDGISFSRFLDNSNIINKDSLGLKAIFSILEDQKGNMWFGSCIGEGLICFDGKALKRISPKGYARTQNLVEDKKGNIWFASIGKGMNQYNGTSIINNFFKEKSTYDLLYTILKDKNDGLWFSESSNNRAVNYYNGTEIINFSEIHNTPNKKMFPILEDKTGNIWFSAEGMGLYKWDGKAFSGYSE